MKTQLDFSNKRVTINDIAREAGVAKSTVSFVLNRKTCGVTISEATRKRVMDIVKAFGYQPNYMARSLKTRQTGNIGFFLSDTVEGGLTNMFFASIMTGVEEECRRQGYGLQIGLFNLTCIDSFIFPTPIRQQCVDGVILAGFVPDEILDKFSQNNIRFVCIGDYMDRPERVCAICLDTIANQMMLIRHLVGLGHRRIASHSPTTPRDLVEAKALACAVKSEFPDIDFQLIYTDDHWADFSAAKPLFEKWMAMPASQRPTALVCTDQTGAAMLDLTRRHSISCPRDFSIAVTGDTVMNRMMNPMLTAIHCNLPQLGTMAADVLIGHLKNHTSPTPADSRKLAEAELIVRESTGPARG